MAAALLNQRALDKVTGRFQAANVGFFNFSLVLDNICNGKTRFNNWNNGSGWFVSY
jgi:hypothetical protein